jgi:hypothetical protein
MLAAFVVDSAETVGVRYEKRPVTKKLRSTYEILQLTTMLDRDLDPMPREPRIGLMLTCQKERHDSTSREGHHTELAVVTCQSS